MVFSRSTKNRGMLPGILATPALEQDSCQHKCSISNLTNVASLAQTAGELDNELKNGQKTEEGCFGVLKVSLGEINHPSQSQCGIDY